MEEIAKNIVEELKKGKDFAELAREISLDEESAKMGGKWDDWITEGEDDLGIGNVDKVFVKYRDRVMKVGQKWPK